MSGVLKFYGSVLGLVAAGVGAPIVYKYVQFYLSYLSNLNGDFFRSINQ